VYGKERKTGEEWLITKELTTSHIIDVYEQKVKDEELVVLE
jgi:Major Vault Protein repeat domain